MKEKTAFLKLIFLLVLAFYSTVVSAQWKVGVQAGYTNNSLATESGYAYDRRYEALGGFMVSVPVQYEFVDWFALQADLSYMQKNYSLSRSGRYSDVHSDVRNGFMSLPVYAHFSFGGTKLRGFLNAGAYVGYWMSSRIKGAQAQYFHDFVDTDDMASHHFNEKVPFDSRRDNRFDGGLSLGVGLKYRLSPQLWLMAEGRYYYGLTDLQKKYMLKQVHRYNETLTIQVGCMVELGSLSKKK